MIVIQQLDDFDLRRSFLLLLLPLEFLISLKLLLQFLDFPLSLLNLALVVIHFLLILRFF